MIGFLCRCGSPNKAFQSFILMLSTLYVLVLVVCFGSTFSWQSKGQKIYPLSSGQKRWYEIIAPRCSLESKSTSRTGSPIVSFAKLLVTLSTSLAFTTASPLLGIHNCVAVTEDFEVKKFKIPYNHVNMDVEKFIGSKASVVFNMKLDDPQTKFQFPGMVELFEKFKDQGLNVLAFPTDQGYFEPDDDETCRAKAKEYLGFGDFPRAVVFDKVDLLGSSAHPFYAYLTARLPTPNGNNKITLNYEKFLLDSSGTPVRRYPRKVLPSEMEQDIQALISGQPLPAPSTAFLKAWREANTEVQKSEYAFRYNYNYYDSPNSIYKYNPERDER